jgi:aryl-alcohol dehydrogenase-like predicted oxidoreductase
MEQRSLGSQGLMVSALGLGCMGMSQSYGAADEDEALATIRTALDSGITMLDTADMYGPFTNEQLVGKAIAGRRDEVVLATKFGFERDSDGTLIGVNGRPDYVRRCIDASLLRLGVDHVDIYFQHRVDPNVPVEETWGAMGAQVTAGKVRYLGISEAAPATIRRAHATHPMTAIQDEWSIFSRDLEDEAVPAARELGIGIVAYSPMGRGLLTGSLGAPDEFATGDFRRRAPRFQGENYERNRVVVERLGELAAARGITTPQLALAWVLARGGDVVPIPGTKRRTYLRDNVAAAEVELEADDLEAIEEVAPRGVAAGDRYPSDNMARVGL